jgi:hypothetical protein
MTIEASLEALERQWRERAEDARTHLRMTEAVHRDGCADDLAALLREHRQQEVAPALPERPAPPEEQVRWRESHLRRGHTVTKQSDFDLCSCDATFWPAALPPPAPPKEPVTVDEVLSVIDRWRQKLPLEAFLHSDGQALWKDIKDLFRNKAAVAPPAPPTTEKDYKALYHQLLYAVSSKHPDESRHQTALRYILQAERSGGPVSAALGRVSPPSQETK